MGSSMLRCICRKEAAGNCIFRGIFSRTVSTVSSGSNESVVGRIPPSRPWVLPSHMGGQDYKLHRPWILPSHMEGQDHKLHSPKAEEESSCISIVGSTHGFLALCKGKKVYRVDCMRYVNDLPIEVFLYNPVSGRRINLPPVPQGFGTVNKVIITGEEGGEDFRAVVRFCTDMMEQTLAYCCPGRSKDWVLIGEEHYYLDFVYSPTYKLLFAIPDNGGFEGWDLGDPLSPRRVWKVTIRDSKGGLSHYDYDDEGYCVPLVHRDVDSDDSGFDSDSDQSVSVSVPKPRKGVPMRDYWDSSDPVRMKYLVASQEKREIFSVTRFAKPDTWDVLPMPGVTPTTLGFQVHKVKVGKGENKGRITLMDDDLDGLVMYVGGITDGVAVAGQAGGFPPPNSISFSDDEHGHDRNHGVFDYETASFHVPPRTLNQHIWISPTTG